jgi:DegV family protein with EDD domain
MADRQAGAGSRRVAVVTDTTTYVPLELYERLDVSLVSLYVGWNGNMEREDSWRDLDAFYTRLRESPVLPTTSQPSVGDFASVYERELGAGRDVVSIHIAAGLSGTCDSAREAARSLGDAGARIHVVDGETGAGGLGCMVLAAGRAAAEGAGAAEVAAAAQRTRDSLAMWFCLDTLEYLRRGGRIGAAQALVGSALKIKPILTFGTEITPVDKVRTRSRAMQRMESYLAELRDRGAGDWIVQHAQSPADAERLCERGAEILGKPPLFCTEVGPVLGAHLGSGMLVGGIGVAPAAD